MVEKKLNFNQPILSVRRCSLKMPSDEMRTKNVVPRLHPHRPDLNSGPVRHPGGVPFQWEQIPGKPKEQTKRPRDIVAEVSPCPNISSSGNEIKDESLVDEIDSLSRTESFISSCSASSLNGADERNDDGPDSSTTFLTTEPQEEVKKEVVKQEKPGFWYRPTFAKSCSYYNDKEVKQVCQGHDLDRGRDQDERFLTICCLLPRSCLKSSVCFENPVPATSVMARFSVFPCTGILLSGCSSADSLSETENEDTVKPNVKANVVKDIARMESCDDRLSFDEGFESCKNSFKTLQELLADEDNRKERESTSVNTDTTGTCGDHLSSLVDEKSKKITPKPLGRDEDLFVDSRNKKSGTNEEKKQLSRATTLGAKFPVPPPLPRSPSDSWLFRTMATKRAPRSSFMSRFSNKS